MLDTGLTTTAAGSEDNLMYNDAGFAGADAKSQNRGVVVWAGTKHYKGVESRNLVSTVHGRGRVVRRIGRMSSYRGSPVVTCSTLSRVSPTAWRSWLISRPP